MLLSYGVMFSGSLKKIVMLGSNVCIACAVCRYMYVVYACLLFLCLVIMLRLFLAHCCCADVHVCIVVCLAQKKCKCLVYSTILLI